MYESRIKMKAFSHISICNMPTQLKDGTIRVRKF